MMELLIRLDDLGFSEGVNYGIAKVVHTRKDVSVGMMMNMDSIQHGFDLIKDHVVCLGIHMNITAGKPISAWQSIPSLVDEHHEFHKSKIFREAKEDIVTLEDVEIECEAQYQAFVKMTSRKPDYIDIHAVSSENYIKGVEMIAKRHNILFSGMGDEHNLMKIDHKEVSIMVATHSMESCTMDIEHLYHDNFSGIHIMVFHPGYVDSYIMEHSSLHTHRAYDVKTLTSTAFEEFLQTNAIHCITYCDL